MIAPGTVSCSVRGVGLWCDTFSAQNGITYELDSYQFVFIQAYVQWDGQLSLQFFFFLMRVKFNKAILNYILVEKYDTNVWIQSVVFSINLIQYTSYAFC